MEQTDATLEWVQAKAGRDTGIPPASNGTAGLAHKAHLLTDKDFVPDTYGLIIRKNGGYIVDNVILKGTAVGRWVTREFALPKAESELLAIPMVKSDSRNEFDPCRRSGERYSFPGSLNHLEIGRIEIPLTPFQSEGGRIRLDLCYDQGELRVVFRVPDIGIKQELSLFVG